VCMELERQLACGGGEGGGLLRPALRLAEEGAIRAALPHHSSLTDAIAPAATSQPSAKAKAVIMRCESQCEW
jgi:hypothetical protein